jgi:hypothetical protein
MLAGVINLSSLVASKARLNSALRRQHSRVVNNESEELSNQTPHFPFLMDFLVLWKAYSSPKWITSSLPVIRPQSARTIEYSLNSAQAGLSSEYRHS